MRISTSFFPVALLLATTLTTSAFDGSGRIHCKKNMSGAKRGYAIAASVTTAGSILASIFCPPCALIVSTLTLSLGALSQVPESFTCPEGTFQDGEYCIKEVGDELMNMSNLLDNQFSQCLHNVWGCQNDPSPNCQSNVRDQCKRDREAGTKDIWRAMEGIERACNE